MAPYKTSLLLATACLQGAMAISNHLFYDLWWYMPEGAKVTVLESTMVVPKVSSGNGIHYVWPGMVNTASDFVFQNVLGDDRTGSDNKLRPTDGKATDWTFATWDVPEKTGTEEYGVVGDIHECDKIWSNFELNTSNNKWNDPWTLHPGEAGQKAGRKKDSGGISVTLPADIVLDRILFALEIYDGAWDVGDLTFEHILMESDTADTAWCGKPTAQQGTFKYTMTNAVAKVVNGRAQCFIEKLVMHQP